jgi:hypothetical protein
MSETLSFESTETCFMISKPVQFKVNIVTGDGNLVRKLVFASILSELHSIT